MPFVLFRRLHGLAGWFKIPQNASRDCDNDAIYLQNLEKKIKSFLS